MDLNLDSLFFALAQIFILVGLIGLLIPIFPGIVVIWITILIYGALTGFSTLGTILFVIITLLMIAGSIVDNVLMGAGARRAGASWGTILLAYAAGIAGTFLFPPLGGLIAAPLVILLLQSQQTGDWKKAWGTVKQLALGWGMSFFARLGIGLLMMGLWWLWVWKG